MTKQKVKIVGDGAFGTFLRTLLRDTPYLELTEGNDAFIIILAVPFNAYPEVAAQYPGKLLVNVCSIQDITNDMCLAETPDVLGIHPLFGARTPNNQLKVCLITNRATTPVGRTLEEKLLCAFQFKAAVLKFDTPEGYPITGEWHDRLMAKSHYMALEIAEAAEPLVNNIGHELYDYLPASVARMRDLVEQIGDMPPGTRESIKANPYGKSIKEIK